MSRAAPSRLSWFCAGVIEAAWLSAVILVPITCSPDLARSFEMPKVIFLRILALIVLAAWVTKFIDQRMRYREEAQRSVPWLLKTPLFLLVAGLTLSFVLATVFSIDVATSMWGSYDWLEGTYTFFCYLTFRSI